MNLLLTGCSGFIGLNFLDYLLKNTQNDFKQIFSIDKLGYATKYNKQKYFELCNDNKIINIDQNINDISGNINLNKDKFIILNFASESHVDNSIENPFGVFNENVKIPESCIRIVGGINFIERFIQISTDEIYSEISYDDIKNPDKWFKVDTPIHPNNPYSASKAAQDCILMSLKHTYGLNVQFIRMANQMPGKYQYPEKMLPASIVRVLNGEPVKIYGEGKNIRQWTPVDITVKVIYDILYNKIDEVKNNEVIHIANRNGIRNNNEIIEILKGVMKEFGYKIDKEYITDRKGHDTAYALDTLPIIDKYFENCDIERTMRECVEYFINNKNIFGNIIK